MYIRIFFNAPVINLHTILRGLQIIAEQMSASKTFKLKGYLPALLQKKACLSRASLFQNNCNFILTQKPLSKVIAFFWSMIIWYALFGPPNNNGLINNTQLLNGYILINFACNVCQQVSLFKFLTLKYTSKSNRKILNWLIYL